MASATRVATLKPNVIGTAMKFRKLSRTPPAASRPVIQAIPASSAAMVIAEANPARKHSTTTTSVRISEMTTVRGTSEITAAQISA